MQPDIVTLDNGIRLATLDLPHCETASVYVLCKVGTRQEPIEINGISHFLEHMFFKGTQKRSAYDIAVQFDDIGGYINAYTSKEFTVFHTQTLKENTVFSIEFLADLLCNSVFDEQEIAREKNVVIQEIYQTMDTPDEYVFDLHSEVAFKGQPLGQPILGTEPIIQSLTRQQLLDYKNKHYRPENIIIAVAGNIQQAKIKEAVQQYFIFNESRTHNTSFQPSRYKGGEFRVNRPMQEHINIVIGFEGFSCHHPNNYTQQLLAMIMGEGMSSRLFQKIREEKALAYQISSMIGSYQEVGKFMIYSSTEPSKIWKLINEISVVLQEAAQGIEEKEIERAVTQVKSSLLMSMESNSAQAEEIVRCLAVYDRYIPREEVLEKISSIGKRDIEHCLQQILASDICVTAIGNLEGHSSYRDYAIQSIER